MVRTKSSSSAARAKIIQQQVIAYNIFQKKQVLKIFLFITFIYDKDKLITMKVEVLLESLGTVNAWIVRYLVYIKKELDFTAMLAYSKRSVNSHLTHILFKICSMMFTVYIQLHHHNKLLVLLARSFP